MNLSDKIYSKVLSYVLGYNMFNKRKHVWDRLRRGLGLDSVSFLQKFSKETITLRTIVDYLHDFMSDSQELKNNVYKYSEHKCEGFKIKFYQPMQHDILCMYMLTRLLKPNIVIETGCATGWTSSLFLMAMNRNKKGTLYTIDLPSKAGERSMDWTIPKELQCGFLIPDNLIKRWEFIQGDTRQELIPLLGQLPPIDIFFHDSDHTYQHMMFEYTSAWPSLREGGILMSDDIGWSTVWPDFMSAMGKDFFMFDRNDNFGVAIK